MASLVAQPCCASLSQGTGDLVYSSLKVGIFDCIGNHSEYYWMIWLFCTIHWLFLCGVNFFSFGDLVASSSARPYWKENRMCWPPHAEQKSFINRDVHSHIDTLSSSEAITVKLLSLDKMAELPHRPIGPIFYSFFNFIFVFFPSHSFWCLAQ